MSKNNNDKNNMKTYTIALHYEYIALVDVDAENETDALNIANGMANSINVSEMDCVGMFDAEVCK